MKPPVQISTRGRIAAYGFSRKVGSERPLHLWAYQRGVVLDFSRPGKPTDNTLADAAEKLEAWRRYYNEERPNGAISNKVPIMLTKSGCVTSLSP